MSQTSSTTDLYQPQRTGQEFEVSAIRARCFDENTRAVLAQLAPLDPRLSDRPVAVSYDWAFNNDREVIGHEELGFRRFYRGRITPGSINHLSADWKVPGALALAHVLADENLRNFMVYELNGFDLTVQLRGLLTAHAIAGGFVLEVEVARELPLEDKVRRSFQPILHVGQSAHAEVDFLLRAGRLIEEILVHRNLISDGHGPRSADRSAAPRHQVVVRPA